jgi:anti-sigma B factor antagonist
MIVDFNVSVDRTQPAIPIVSVTGEVDMATAPELLHELQTLAAGRPLTIVVDLTAVGFLDASGISALAQTHKQLQIGSGQLIVVTSTAIILQLFETTGIDQAIRVSPTLADALDATKSA